MFIFIFSVPYLSITYDFRILFVFSLKNLAEEMILITLKWQKRL